MRKDYEKTVTEILKYLNINGADLFKKAHMGKPSITYFEIFYALCEYGDRATTTLDINKKTFTTNMRKLFPNKPGNNTGWFKHIFNLIGTKRCNSCGDIKDKQLFGPSSDNTDRLDASCLGCRYKYRLLHKEDSKERSKRHYIENKHKYIEKGAKRRSSKLLATTKWYEKDLITELYKKSSMEVHIDHIIPLVNDLVCGLHCFDNLEAISAFDNISKSNKFDSEYIEDLIIYNLALDGLATYEFNEGYYELC